MITFKEQGGMILPVGEGIGATQEGKLTMSPSRAAGKPPVNTDDEPIATMPGPAGTQLGIMQGMVWLVTIAAGRLLIKTVATTAVMIGIGIGGCGMGVGTGAAG